MDFYTIHNYKKLDKFFFKILNSKFATWRTYCVSTLQFIKPHPEYFIKYKLFFYKSKIIFIILFLQYFLTFFKVIKMAYKKN